MLESENSTAVRKAVLATLPYSTFTHPYFVERTRDVSDDVSWGQGSHTVMLVLD